VEIEGFRRVVRVTYCKIMRSSMAKVVGPQAGAGFPVGSVGYSGVVDVLQAKVLTRHSGR
jgi:hypothetical protein